MYTTELSYTDALIYIDALQKENAKLREAAFLLRHHVEWMGELELGQPERRLTDAVLKSTDWMKEEK